MNGLQIIRLVPRTALSESKLKGINLSKNAALLATAIANIKCDSLGGLRQFVPLNTDNFDGAARELFAHGIVGEPIILGDNDNE